MTDSLPACFAEPAVESVAHADLITSRPDEPVFITHEPAESAPLREFGVLAVARPQDGNGWKVDRLRSLTDRVVICIGTDPIGSGDEWVKRDTSHLRHSAREVRIYHDLYFSNKHTTDRTVAGMLATHRLQSLGSRQFIENAIVESVDLTNRIAAPPEPVEEDAGDEGQGNRPMMQLPEWPAPPDLPARYGLAGEIVDAVGPHTEADPIAILIQLLTGFGNVIGDAARYRVEATDHHANEFACLVGESAKARKGTSWGHVRLLLDLIDPLWSGDRIMSGLSSGEGLIYTIRDPVMRREPIKDKGRVTGYQDIEADPGVTDKRILVQESEFGRTLKVLSREGNTLSALLRDGWDSRTLQNLTRQNPMKATSPHVSLLAHVTRDELSRLMSQGDIVNGVANRFLWVAVRRSKRLPFGGSPDESTMAGLGRRLRDAADFGKALTDPVRFDPEAARLWDASYDALTAERPGAFGAVTGRAEAHAVRLALIYAVIDQSTAIRAEHLQAALALWAYCERSAAYIFGDSTGDDRADKVLKALRSSPGGLTRQQIRAKVFSNNLSSDDITATLRKLEGWGLAYPDREETGGRPAERWRAGTRPTP